MLKIAIDFDGVIIEQPKYPELNYKFVDGPRKPYLSCTILATSSY